MLRLQAINRAGIAERLCRSSPKRASFVRFKAPSKFIVRASTETENKQREDKKKRELVGQIEESLKKSGFTSASAKEVLKRWQNDVGHEITPDDLRKVLVGQSTKVLGLVLFSTLLDGMAAYGSVVAGNFLGVASEQYGLPAVIGQVIAFILAGYYASGAVFDLFKLSTLVVATIQFNVNAPAFLEAVEDIAGTTGLGALDKAVEAVNSVKVLQAINTMSDLLKESSKPSASSADMLTDLGAYLTLEKAQRTLGFDAAAFGLTDAQAAEIAVVFGKYDLNGDGVLQEDEFIKLCAKFLPDLSEAEAKAALKLVDLNKDGSIAFDEFCKWWKKEIM